MSNEVSRSIPSSSLIFGALATAAIWYEIVFSVVPTSEPSLDLPITSTIYVGSKKESLSLLITPSGGLNDAPESLFFTSFSDNT